MSARLYVGIMADMDDVMVSVLFVAMG